jgi:RNA polymerase sigma-70 factor (ECF subfamily)
MTMPGERGEPWFAALYTAHHRDIVRYGLRRGADAEPAEELAQEVFVIAWRRREHVADIGLPWLYGVARRVLANSRRSDRTAPATTALDDPDRVPASAAQTGPDTVAGTLDLRAALAALSEPDQEILRLIGWEQLTVAEAALVLGCGRAAARVRLHRARRRLRAVMEEPEHPSVPQASARNAKPDPAAAHRPVTSPQWRS